MIVAMICGTSFCFGARTTMDHTRTINSGMSGGVGSYRLVARGHPVGLSGGAHVALLPPHPTGTFTASDLDVRQFLDT